MERTGTPCSHLTHSQAIACIKAFMLSCLSMLLWLPLDHAAGQQAMTYQARYDQVQASDDQANTVNAVADREPSHYLQDAKRAVKATSSLISVQLLDNWQPETWYQASADEKNLIDSLSNSSIRLVQFQEEVPAKKDDSAPHSGGKMLAPYDTKPIERLGVEIGRKSGKTPRNRAIEDGVFDAHPSQVTMRTWPITTRTWTAPNTKHRPLYFEEVNAERYGYTCSRVFQPVISSAHFFGTVPFLPYLMTADPPCQCNYTLGHYRPGSCPPRRPHHWPISFKGAGVEAAVAIGMIALIP